MAPTIGAVITGLDSSQASATCARGMPRRRDRRHAIDDLAVRLGGVREEARDRLVGLGPDARVVPVARQPPTSLRAPRNDADPLGRTERQHFALLLAVEQVHEVLHADEAGPAAAFGNSKIPSELPSVQATPSREGPRVRIPVARSAAESVSPVPFMASGAKARRSPGV